MTKTKWELSVGHSQGGSLTTVSRSNWHLEMLVFLGRGENRSTGEKLGLGVFKRGQLRLSQ